jgi:hypothetical protein
MCSSARYAALLVLLLASVARAAETETQYLSGDAGQSRISCPASPRISPHPPHLLSRIHPALHPFAWDA